MALETIIRKIPSTLQLLYAVGFLCVSVAMKEINVSKEFMQ